MNEFRFICARLILYEHVLKILSVTERHTIWTNVRNCSCSSGYASKLIRRAQDALCGWVQNEDQRPKNEDPIKIVLKSLEKGSNMILDQSRNKEQQYLRLSTNLTRVFVLYITLPNVQIQDPSKIVLKSPIENSSKQYSLLDHPKLVWLAVSGCCNTSNLFIYLLLFFGLGGGGGACRTLSTFEFL